MTTPQLFTRNDAAAYLTGLGVKTAPGTLAKLFCIGGGPKCRHIGRRPFYERADLLDWIEGRLTEPRQSSSEPRRLERSGLHDTPEGRVTHDSAK